MDNKKKITIAVVAVAIVIAIAIIVFLLTKNTNTVYTISFNTDGGNEVVSQQVEEGEKVTKPADPSKEGYEFLGWYLNGAYFDFQTEVEGNLTLEAKWKAVVEDTDTNVDKDTNEEEKTDEVTKYTVTFESNGGSSVAKQTVEKNKTAKEPSAPTKSGYTFKGWYLGSTKYSFSTKVTKNLTLTAKWEKVEENTTEPETPEVKEYTVTFNSNGGTSVTKQTIEEGKTATAPKNPTYTGYTFLGWYLNGEKFDFSTAITSNITLKAEWKKNDVVSYIVEDVANSVANQVRIYVTLNGEKVAGTVEMTSTSGKTVTVEVPATGVVKTKGTYTSISNPKVK